MKIIDDKTAGKKIKFRIQEMFDNYSEFYAYTQIFSLLNKLGYENAPKCWRDNPRVTADIHIPSISITEKTCKTK